jgi:hypothetical protein
MDLLRIFVAGWALIVLLSTALTVTGIGKPREPMTPGTAGCIVTLNIITFTGFLFVWLRLGA